MKITKIPGLGNYGVFIDGVDFENLIDEEWTEICKIYVSNLVAIIRNCNLNPTKQYYWSEKLGPIRYLMRYRMLKKYPGKKWNDIVKLSLKGSSEIDEIDRYHVSKSHFLTDTTPNGKSILRVSGKVNKYGDPLGMFATGKLLWHSNESGNLTFSPGVNLLGCKNMVGSATGFLTTADYYENVSESFRSELNEMVIIHRFTPGKITPGLSSEQDELMRGNMCPEDNVEIPLIIQSPGGIKGLHYSINTIHSIKGMGKEESDRVFEEINKELFVDKYIYDHWYKTNDDFLLFDNSITLHRRLGGTEERLAYRIQHDYSTIQDTFWQPYFQEEYAKKYIDETNEYSKLDLEDCPGLNGETLI